MPELVDLYCKGLKRKLANYWGAWLPGSPVALGDIGVLKGHRFEKVGALRELGLRFHAQAAAGPTPLDLTSESGVQVRAKAAGASDAAFTSIGAAEAGFRIDFGEEGAFVIQSPATYDQEVEDRLNLQHQIVDAFRRGVWEKDWVVVTRAVSARCATVLISRSANASVELSAKADIGQLVTMGSADAGIEVRRMVGDTFSMIAAPDVTPLFQLARLKTRLFGRPALRTRALRTTDPSLADVTPDRASSDPGLLRSLSFDTIVDDELD